VANTTFRLLWKERGVELPPGQSAEDLIQAPDRRILPALGAVEFVGSAKPKETGPLPRMSCAERSSMPMSHERVRPPSEAPGLCASPEELQGPQSPLPAPLNFDRPPPFNSAKTRGLWWVSMAAFHVHQGRCFFRRVGEVLVKGGAYLPLRGKTRLRIAIEVLGRSPPVEVEIHAMPPA